MRVRLSVLMALLALPVVQVLAQGMEIPRPQSGYSAVRVIEVAGNTLESTVHAQGLKERTETSMQGQSMTTIVRADLGVIWIMMPGGFYMEQPMDAPTTAPGAGPPTLSDAADVLEFTEEGPEQVNGLDTTRFRIQAENPDGSAMEGQIWLTDLNIPVRTVMTVESQGRTDEVVVSLRDLEVGDQPDSLFVVPEGQEKLSIPGLPGLNPFGR